MVMYLILYTYLVPFYKGRPKSFFFFSPYVKLGFCHIAHAVNQRKYKYNTGSSNVTYNQDLALLKNISIEEIEGTQIPLEENINTTTQHNKSHVKVHSVEAIPQKLIKASYHQTAIIECWKKKSSNLFSI